MEKADSGSKSSQVQPAAAGKSSVVSPNKAGKAPLKPIHAGPSGTNQLEVLQAKMEGHPRYQRMQNMVDLANSSKQATHQPQIQALANHSGNQHLQGLSSRTSASIQAKSRLPFNPSNRQNTQSPIQRRQSGTPGLQTKGVDKNDSVLQRAVATNDDFLGNRRNINTLAGLNALLAGHGFPALTAAQIFRHVGGPGKPGRLNANWEPVTLSAGWQVDESILPYIGDRTAANYTPLVDQAIAAWHGHFLESALPAVTTLHVGDMDTAYHQGNVLGEIRDALRTVVQARALVTDYTEGAVSVSVAALNQLLNAVGGGIALDVVFNSLTNPVAGNNWNGTKQLVGSPKFGGVKFARELKLAGAGARRIGAKETGPNDYTTYIPNGFH